MLRLILGRSGSGKTYLIHQMIEEMAKNGNEKLLLLIPEQCSFERERAMLQLLGDRLFQTVEIMSFTRLSDLVFRKTGGLAGKRLDDGGRAILMSLALEAVQDQLVVYQKQSDSIEMVNLMLEAEKECKTCGIFPEEMRQVAQQIEEGSLQNKLQETALILDAYQALVQRSYIDPLEDLTRLYQCLQEERFFEGYTIFVDSFSGFTMQEMKVLEQMMIQSKDLYVSLCLDSTASGTSSTSLFSQVQKTASSLKRLAQKHQIPVALPICLKDIKRFPGQGLQRVEQFLYREQREQWDAPITDVSIYNAANPYDESEYVALTIRRLVMEQGMRYRDFEVICRDAQPYRGILDNILEKYEIPYFMDKPEKIDIKPLMNLVLTAFDIVQNGWTSTDLFRYLKTGLAGLETEETSVLENYVLLWSISGKKWREPFSSHPDGFSSVFSEQERQELEKINQLRVRVVEPLLHFEKKLIDANGQQISRAVYDLLMELHTGDALKRLTEALEADGNIALAEEQERLWDLLMQILDQIALVLGEHSISPRRYVELLRLIINCNDLAFIPQGLDEVTVGLADRARPAEPKMVFLLGAQEGEFPKSPTSSGVFSDAERRMLLSLGLPMYDSLEERAVEERFAAYMAAASPSDRLFLSWHRSDGSGASKAPSSLIREVKRLLKRVPQSDEYTLDPKELVWAVQPAFELTARMWSSQSPYAQTLKRYFLGQETFSSRLKALDRAAQVRPIRFEDPAKAKRLFGEQMKISASQIEKYYLCKFQYFCRYGLRAKERKPASFDALEYGSLMHYLLEHMLKKHAVEFEEGGIPQWDKQEITDLLERYVEEYLGGWQDKTPRFRFLFSRLASTAELLLRHIIKELSQSEFQPQDYELAIGAGGEIAPFKIALPGGACVEVEGKVDRVDVMHRHGKSYVRIVDYKTGSKEFRLSDILYGLNMQMLLYMAAIWKNGEPRYGSVMPAGVLYMPATRPVVNAQRGEHEEKALQEQEKKLRMNGLLLDDAEVISGMEHKAQGVFIPVALKDGKPAKLDSVANLAQMGMIVKHIEHMVQNMAQSLQQGDISAVPAAGEYDACAYCPYRPVCGYEQDGDNISVQKWDRKRVMEQLEKQGGEQ